MLTKDSLEFYKQTMRQMEVAAREFEAAGELEKAQKKEKEAAVLQLMWSAYNSMLHNEKMQKHLFARMENLVHQIAVKIGEQPQTDPRGEALPPLPPEKTWVWGLYLQAFEQPKKVGSEAYDFNKGS